MIGNVIQRQVPEHNDYPAAAALGFVLVIGVMVHRRHATAAVVGS